MQPPAAYPPGYPQDPKAAGSYGQAPAPQYYSAPPQAPAPMYVAPGAVAPAPGPPSMQQWHTGLLSCCEDCFVCWNSTPCMYAENNRKVYGGGFCGAFCIYCWFPCCSCCFADKVRGSVRSKYNLPAEPCGDCCVHFWCSPCAVCQEAREMRIRERWQTWQ